MITFNGIELDIYQNSLKPPVLKRSLSSLQNLKDRKGTVSTEFNIPRTPKNELAFNNATVAGSQTQAVGDGVIYIDDNVYQQGKIYLRGFNDGDISAVFIGDDLDLMSILKNKRLSDLIPYNFKIDFTNADFKDKMPQLNTTPLIPITFIVGSPFSVLNFFNNTVFDVTGNENRNKKTLKILFTLKSLFIELFRQNGYSINSDFIDTDYFEGIMYGTWKGTHQASANAIGKTISNPTLNKDDFDVGVLNWGSDLITRSSEKYIFQVAVNELEVRLKVDYSPTDDNIINTSIYFQIFDNTDDLKFNSKSSENSNLLQQGENFLKFNLEKEIQADWYIVFYHTIRTITGTATGTIFKVQDVLIKTDYIDDIDEASPISQMSLSNYLSDVSQFDFLKGVLNDFNLLMDIKNKEVFIDLKDDGVEPFFLTPLQSLSKSNVIDITDKIEAKNNVEFETLNEGLIYLKQKILENRFSKEQSPIKFQEFGSYLFNILSINSKEVLTFESFFTSGSDSWDIYYLYGFGNFDELADEDYYNGDINFENCLFFRAGTGNPSPENFEYSDLIYNQLRTFNYKDNSSASTGFINNFSLVNFFTRFSYTWDKLFINTLKKKAQNFTRSIRLYDHLGTLISFRNKYVIDGQLYSLQSYDYNLETKLVNAKLLLENG